MYFKRLELVGFKSFCDKTTLHFEPGITAIVGPNGCGKSNIFDSLRWVLGEQSAKSLRGSEMQDVIFNGTDAKEPLSMAEVTVAFDNRERFFNFDHSEVALTRRIFRSGESEYLLNKTPVRLKDILDLLLGTGIGAESYSIVAQGKIDLVLSSRPEDRRLVFDEASGITKYKAQKREALRKLEETEQNLLRINDIITEVKRQILSLERQANKARRYKEVFEELKTKEISLSVLHKDDLLKQKNELIKQLEGLESKEIELLNILREQEEKIANRQTELRNLENKMMESRNEILSLENMIVRNNEHMTFNKEKIIELAANKKYLQDQIKQIKEEIVLHKEKLNSARQEYANISKEIEGKSLLLKEKEARINGLALSIKSSLESISLLKKEILDLVSKITNIKNEIADFNSKKQIHLARKKRLEVEKAKVNEERAVTEESLNSITQEVGAAKRIAEEIKLKILGIKSNLLSEAESLNDINSQIADLEKQRLGLESHKEFLEELKTKYEDIGEVMNAVIFLDKLPSEKMSGLVIKIKDHINLSDEDKAYFEPAGMKLSGEAKPIELDTQKIEEKIANLQRQIDALKAQKQAREASIEELNRSVSGLQQDLHNQEIALANKETSRLTVLEQFNKIKEEEGVIQSELSDVQEEISSLEEKLVSFGALLMELTSAQGKAENTILEEENSIALNSKLREEVLVIITQTKTELEALNKRLVSDEATLKILEDTFRQRSDSLENIEKQIKDSEEKTEALDKEIENCENKIIEFDKEIKSKNADLGEKEKEYAAASEGASDVVKKIETDRKELDDLKNKLYELQMQDKDIDYKYSSIKERMLQAYKIDLGAMESVQEVPDANVLSQEIETLKQKLDSYGTVNLVAIEEYDELKKRYDFLIQQQTDLLTAKESLHQAILKINRTTKEMFLDTFEKVRAEFRNYFRTLFNGGDAQVFLIDEQDPLESGIEIICRPPGKKLQNVLLLSGGEKSLSAIALIFAIFKVKPSPFCVLDEIDAALDEANVERFSRVLQEFAKTSQFITITHNKRTIANADVMYGITMEQSGVSKIVSVKFARGVPTQDKEAEVTVAESV